MPDLKTIRGTVLYAKIIFDSPAGAGQTIVVPVFSMTIAGIKLNTFLLENSGEQSFGDFFAEMNQGTAVSCTLSISNPDGTFLTTAPIAFGGIVTVGWSEAILTAFGPVIDPNWVNNPNYITMNQQFTATAHGA
jgi:hypothetical protein